MDNKLVLSTDKNSVLYLLQHSGSLVIKDIDAGMALQYPQWR